jgi:uncharacterized protein
MEKEKFEKRVSLPFSEVRNDAEKGSVSVSGYAVVFDEKTTIGGQFEESVSRSAFEGVDFSKTFALYNHDWEKPLGKVGRNLSLSIDEKGLRYDLQMTGTSYAQDVVRNIEAGIIEGCSFGFTIAEDSWQRSQTGGLPSRVIERVGNLHEITLTHVPAYPTTDVALRSMDAALGEVEEPESNLSGQESNETAPEVSEAVEEQETPSEAPEMASEDVEQDQERAQVSKEELLKMKGAKKAGEPEAMPAQATITTTTKKSNSNKSKMEQIKENQADEIRGAAPVDSVQGQARNFDFGKMVREMAQGKVSGLEAEITQEGATEATRSGISTTKGVFLPSAVLRASTDSLLGSNNWGGGAAPATQQFTQANVAADIASLLGIQRMTGLVGNVLLPFVDKALTTAANEGASATQVTSPFGTATLTPQRFTGRIDVSGQLMAQTSVDLGTFLQTALLRDVDAVFSAYIATQLLAADDDVTGDSNAIMLEARMLANDILPENIGVVCGTTAFRGARDEGIGLGGAGLVVANDPRNRNAVLDYPTAVSSKVAAAQMTMIDRSGFMVGEWGGANVVVDNMTLAQDDMYRVIINTYKDFKAHKANAAFTVTTYGTANS